MKAYGIRDTKNDEWLHYDRCLLWYYTPGAAEAQRAILGNQPAHEVAEIGEDGLPVEVEE